LEKGADHLTISALKNIILHFENSLSLFVEHFTFTNFLRIEVDEHPDLQSGGLGFKAPQQPSNFWYIFGI
jgi:hypothetical protein